MLRIHLLVLFYITSFGCSAAELDKARDHINAMEYTQAIGEIEKYLQQNPVDITARFLLARTYAWDNQYDKAAQVYDQLLAKEKDNTQYMFGKAQALIWQNKNTEAITLLDYIVKHVPEEAEPWRLLILALQQSSNPADKQRAHELTKQAKTRFPKMNWDLIAN